MVENSIATKRYSLKARSKQGQQIIKLLKGSNQEVTDELIYSRCHYEERPRYKRNSPMSEAEQTGSFSQKDDLKSVGEISRIFRIFARIYTNNLSR